MQELIAALISAGVAIVGGVAGFVVTTLKNKALKAEVESVKEKINNSEQLYTITCPACGTKIYLNKVNITTEERENNGTN